KASHVTVKGFDLRNVEVSYMKDYAAVKVFEANHVTIDDNLIKNAFFGVYLQRSDSSTISNNTIRGLAKTETSSGNAIHLWYCENIAITNNETSGHRDGIYLEFAKNSQIRNNESFNNIRYGLHFM